MAATRMTTAVNLRDIPLNLTNPAGCFNTAADGAAHGQGKAGPRWDRRGRWPVTVFFALLLLVGLTTFRDYGVYRDEMACRSGCQKLIDYLKTLRDPRRVPVTLSNFHMRHGVVFDAVARATTNLLGLRDARDVLFARHLLGFLTFWAGVAMFFALCTRLFGSWRLSLCASLALTLVPQLYCDAFINNADVPFMSLYIAATLTLVHYLDRPDLKHALLHALASGLAVGMRMAGGIIVLTGILFAIACNARGRASKVSVGERAAGLGVYVLVTVQVVFLLWPSLWADPLHAVPNAVFRSVFSQLDPDTLGTADPSYLPLCFLATMPLLYSVSLFAGVGLSTWHVLRPLPDFPISRRHAALCLFLLAAPIAISLALRTRNYGLLRHFYFLLPTVIVFMIAALTCIWRAICALRPTPVRYILASAAILSVALSAVDAMCILVQAHTFENAYRNPLFQKLAATRVQELVSGSDEECIAERKALDYIVARDSDRHIGVCGPLPLNDSERLMGSMALAPADRDRLRLAAPSAARYAICGGDVPLLDGRCVLLTERGMQILPVKALYYALTFRGRRVISVYRLH